MISNAAARVNSLIFSSQRRLPDRRLPRVQRKLLGDFRQGLIQPGDDHVDGLKADYPRRLYKDGVSIKVTLISYFDMPARILFARTGIAA